VGEILVAEREASLQVLLHDGVGDLDGGVDGFLGLLLDFRALRDVILLLGEELVSLAGLLTLEVVIGDGFNVDLGGIDLGGGGDAHTLVDALERDTVDLAGTGDQKEAGVEHLQEDDALATESATQKDEDLSFDDVLLKDGLGLGHVLASDRGLAGSLAEHQRRGSLGRALSAEGAEGDHLGVLFCFLTKNRWQRLW